MNRTDLQDQPPDFLIALAHESIDNGADAFVGHGPHLLRGIEIYNLSRRGLPMTAPPQIAQRILQRLQKLSEPLGTRIAIEGNEGIIRVASRSSSSLQ